MQSKPNVVSLLKAAEGTFLSQKELATMLQCNKRAIRSQVHAARMAGVPIISGTFGYGLAKSPHEVKECAARLDAQARSTLEATDGLRKGLESAGTDEAQQNAAQAAERFK